MGGGALQIAVNGLCAGATYSLVATGFFLTYRSSRFFDLSFAATLSAAAYCTYALVGRLQIALPLAIVLGATAGACVAWVFEALVYRPLRGRRATALVRLLASLGVMTVGFNVLSIIFGDSAVLGTTRMPEVFAIASARISAVRLYSLFATGIVLGTAWVLASRSRWGIRQTAVFEDAELATCLGVNEAATTTGGILSGAFVGGLAAALVAAESSIKPGIGFDLVLPGVIACLVAGFRRIEAAAGCALLLGITEQVVGWFFGMAWQEVLVAGLFTLALLVAPRSSLLEPQPLGTE